MAYSFRGASSCLGVPVVLCQAQHIKSAVGNGGHRSTGAPRLTVGMEARIWIPDRMGAFTVQIPVERNTRLALGAGVSRFRVGGAIVFLPLRGPVAASSWLGALGTRFMAVFRPRNAY